MKKLNLSLALFVVLFIAFGCSKDSSSSSGCSFSKSTFENKTYKNSIVKIDSAGVDVTARYTTIVTSDPCFNNTVTLNSDGTWKENKASGCTTSSTTGTWSVSTTNGKNILTTNNSTQEVSAFDCNSMTITSVDGTISFTSKIVKI